jgi:hypothetical protein
MKKFIFFFIFLMIPLATAFPCESIPEQESCLVIQNDPELTQEEKEELYNAIISTEFPDYEFTYNYNTNIEFADPPEDVQTISSMHVKNAWMKIITAMPSILIGNNLYSQEQGEILTAYNYDIELPSGIQGNDCKTTYSISEQTEELNIYQDGNLIGNDLLQEYTINQDSLFTAELIITVGVRVKHYQGHQGHCNIGEYCPTSCQYSHSTSQTSTINLDDQLDIYYYNEEPLGEIILLDELYNSYHGYILAENYTALDLEFQNSEYNLRNYYYDFNFTYQPYYILTIRANEEDSEFINNIIVEEELGFIVSSINNPILTLYNHFNTFQLPQTFNFIDQDLEIETNGLFHKIGDTITVTSNIENTQFEYNGEIITGSQAEFTATQEDQTIKAHYQDKNATKMVFTSSESWGDFYNLGIFGMLIFLINKVGLFFMRRMTL